MQAEQRIKVEAAELRPGRRLWESFTVHGPDGSQRRPVRERDLGDRQYVVVEELD